MIQAPKGTRDVYGDEMKIWRHIESKVRSITDAFGYSEIRTPIFESTDLFLRGVGDTTDIVQKEMYTFEDKGGRSMTLRPELTAGVARAYIERGMHSKPQPTRLWYIGPNFRYENPQAGRYRQHYQFGVEVFGASTPATEAEVISLGWELLASLGVKDVSLHINSIGCPSCRKVYHENLRGFIEARIDSLCGLCRTRADKNPLRILDCKNPACQEILKDAPSVLDALDDECRNHFEDLQKLLTGFGIPFMVNSKVVRGLDYYTRTVFEFIREGESTVIGGGRYDGLIAQVGGADTPGVGFGMGIERLVLLLQKQALMSVTDDTPQIFIGSADGQGFIAAQKLVYGLRKKGFRAESDLLGRSVKAQMKYADKINAQNTMILGENELSQNEAKIKNMQTGEQTTILLDSIGEHLNSLF